MSIVSSNNYRIASMPAIMLADPGMRGMQQHHDPHHINAHLQQEYQRKMQDLETLRHIITQWNANRLDLFELSMPNQELEFTGVMRFYYQAQDLSSGQKVATKCIRVTSTATTKTIIETLIEKFRPDMKMLEMPEYALYEIHESGERRLGLDEKPLLVQLNWHKDDREGRFLLRRIDEASQMPQPTQEDSSFKRKLSKREKKALKKQEKKDKVEGKGGRDESVAEKLYTELPDTSFTRSISNPEAVMRRRRQQKLEKKLQQFRSKDGGPDTGGTLKIYGESLCKDVPYKTLLLSVRDTAAQVVLEMLEKYGISRAEAGNYCLVHSNLSMPDDGGAGQVVGGGTTREYILEDDECPLAILMNHPASRGAVTFHVRRRPPDGQRRRKKKSSSIGQPDVGGLPFLVELTPEGGDSRVVKLQMSVTEVGSEVGGGGVRLPGLLPRHCVIAHTEGVVTVTPCSPGAEVWVNNQRVAETTLLQQGATLRFGRSVWRFIDPSQDGGQPPHHGSTATLPGGMEFQAGMRSSTANYVPYPGGNSSGSSLHHLHQQQQPRGRDAILPAVLEFREDTESAFFNALTINLDPAAVNFKLAPTYTLYMATRFRASTHYRPELVPEERAVRLTEMLNRVADKILRLLATPPGAHHAPTLSFWMANSSELLHFLKSDRHITAFSLQAQDMLADAVHMAFKQLVIALQSELELVLPSLLSDRDEDGEAATAGIVSVFSSAMALLRKCRVNAALTIQLFSQLFHFVNMWTFNTIVSDLNKINYCTHKWGLRLKRRLARIEIWAEKQGLELAADCHLARITQTAHLLQARKGTPEDIATLSSTCFKLNSLQLQCLLSKYQPAEAETPISGELIETIVRVAENTVDELTRGEGRQVRLEEDFVLQLPFLLPEDNYSCDIVRGVPGGLLEFLQPLQAAGLCIMTPQPTSSGHWTIYMDTPPPLTPLPRSPSEMSQIMSTNGDFAYSQQELQQPPHHLDLNGHHHNGGPPYPLPNGHRTSQLMGPPPVGFPNGQPAGNGPMKPPSVFPKHSPGSLPEEPEIQTIRLSKTHGMGLSIVAAKGVGKDRLGIYIKAVVEGGAAWQDGRLEAGDQLLSVDGHSLVGITQERAAEIMMRTGNLVTLEVAKQGAIYHGLAALLAQPSPVLTNTRQTHQPQQSFGGTGQRRMSERDLRGPPLPPANGQPPMVNGYGGPTPLTTGPPNGYGAPPKGPPNGYGPPPSSRIPQSKSTPALHQSPGSDSQHNYQNQEWLHQQLPPAAPAGRSLSTHNLTAGSGRPPAAGPDPDPGYYQNIAPPPLQSHRYGSQSSLSGGSAPAPPPVRERPASALFPRQVATVPAPYHPPPPGGPEKPIRQFSYEGMGEPVVSSSSNMMKPAGQNRVRFQDTTDEEDDSRAPSVVRRNGGPQPGGSSSIAPSVPPLPPTGPPPLSPPLPTSGTARLDMLLGNQPKSKMEPPVTPTKPASASRRDTAATPTKRVSFMPEEEKRTQQVDLDEEEEEEEDDQEEEEEEEDNRLYRSDDSYKQDPNAFINEAENMLNSASLGMGKMDLNSSAPSGHTPSVIGTQEVYRDPRQRRLQQEQEKKLSTAKAPDGSKLSFKEKMKLFAQEVGEGTPREKAKISKAQREIEEERRADQLQQQ